MISDSQSDALTQLGAALDEAVDGRYLDTKPQSPDDTAIKARRRVIGLYLFLLGYLERYPAAATERNEDEGDNSSASAQDEEIESALKGFQRDAGLTVDGWAGDESWNALRELASFEYSTDIARWIGDSGPRPALWRAIYLRLFAFGFTTFAPRPDTRLKSRQKESDRDFRRGMDRFAQAIRLISPEDREMESDPVPATIALLFDQDGISQRINNYLKNSGGLPARKDDRQFIIAFMQCVSRIELWLYGYNTEFGNFRKGGPFISPDRRTQTLASAMSDFIEDQEGEVDLDPKRDTVEALTWFFGQIVSLNRATPDIERIEDAEAVVERVLHDKTMWRDVLDTIKSMGARLWDGVVRVWNWVRSIFETVVKTAKRLVTNVSRYIHEAALKVYSPVAVAIRAVVDGLEFLSEKILRGSDPGQMVVFHDGDLDFNVFVNSSADPTTVANMSGRLELRADILAVGAGIVSELASFVMSIVRFGVSTGWFAIMLALVKLYPTLKHLREYSARALDLFNQLDASRANA